MYLNAIQPFSAIIWTSFDKKGSIAVGGKQIHRMSIYQYVTLPLQMQPQKSYSVKNQLLEPQPIAEEHRVVAFCVKAVNSSLIC